MGTDQQFKTYQTVQYYEGALRRHSQYVRWLKSSLCPCLNETTSQPDPNCSQCNGRGKLYRAPDKLQVRQEIAKHDSYGKIYSKYTPVANPVVWRKGVQLVLGSQPSDGSYIVVDPPYPKAYERVRIDYAYTPLIAVIDEDSEVYAATVLRVIAARFYDKGKSFEGSISEVTKVYNVNRDENYTVEHFAKEFIYLEDMGTSQQGDVLEVSYKYMQPFNFILTGVSQKMRYERAYILEAADTVLITPYFVRVAPNDLLTALSIEQVASSIIQPQSSGNDAIRNYYDVSKLIYVVDVYGQEYVIGTDVELYGRNELKWLTSKPSTKYSVQFYYHPTFAALPNLPSVRSAENKSFVSRVNLVQYDHTDEADF